MSGARRTALALKRRLGGGYRSAQRSIAHVVFERGLQSTESPDVSSGFLYLVRGLRGSRIDSADVLLDYGSGRGRVLLRAAHLPFARVTGVELDREDCAMARANAAALAASGRMRCGEIEVLQVDATAWTVPDDVTYIYMFNPFRGEIFRAALARVIESLDRRPRALTLIYANPTCSGDVIATGRFERVRASRWPRPDKPNQRVEVFKAIGGRR
jgi:SAM-dependent methyltransferase